MAKKKSRGKKKKGPTWRSKAKLRIEKITDSRAVQGAKDHTLSALDGAGAVCGFLSHQVGRALSPITKRVKKEISNYRKSIGEE
jgi:hypothetical protein